MERNEERERLRKELRASRERIHQLHDARRRTPMSQSPSHSRPNSFISISSSASETCDGHDHLQGEEDHGRQNIKMASPRVAFNRITFQISVVYYYPDVVWVCMRTDDI